MHDLLLKSDNKINIWFKHSFKKFTKKHLIAYDKFCILNAISYAPHILLMTAEVNESQFSKFSFQFIWHWSHNNTFKRKLFCRIPVFYNSLGPE